MENAAVDFHDSEVLTVTSSGDVITVRVTAYIHRSAGRPGIDAGTGWSQDIELKFEKGSVVSLPEALPRVLDDASLTGAVGPSNCVPLPAIIDSAVAFSGRGLYGEAILISGISVDIAPVGEPTFVESFPGKD